MDELPVVNEWQTKIYCPNCKHYCTGRCNNPNRKSDTDPCPLINVEPVELQTEFKFTVHSQVKVKIFDGVFDAEVVNRQLSTIGVLYEIKTADNRFWITEECLETK